MNDDFAERLRQVIKATGLEQKDFAAVAELSGQTVTGYLLNGRLPNQRTLAAWVKAFGIDAHWLLTGEGAMFQSKADHLTIRRLAPNAKSEAAVILGPEDDAPVGYVVPVHVAAAAGLPLDQWETEAICRVCVPVSYYRESILVVQIKGRSMEPEIHDGAFVGLDTEQREIIVGERYGVRVPYEGLTVKRIFLNPQDGELILRSINPEHQDMKVDVTDYEQVVIGKAVWVLQKL